MISEISNNGLITLLFNKKMEIPKMNLSSIAGNMSNSAI